MRTRLLRTVVAIGMATAGALGFLASRGQPAIGGQDDRNAVEVEQRRSEDEISVRQLNELHLAVLGRVLDRMERQGNGRKVVLLNVENGSILQDHGTVWIELSKLTGGENSHSLASGDHRALLGGSVRIKGDIGHPLTWTITDHRRNPLFSFWISKRMTSVTVLECDVPSGHLFVNVGWQQSDLADLDTKKPELADCTPRQVLQLLEAGMSDIEQPDQE